MRRILIEAARKKRESEAGGAFVRCELDLEYLHELDRHEGLLAVIEPRAAEIVKLRYLTELTVAEAVAHSMG